MARYVLGPTFPFSKAQPTPVPLPEPGPAPGSVDVESQVIAVGETSVTVRFVVPDAAVVNFPYEGIIVLVPQGAPMPETGADLIATEYPKQATGLTVDRAGGDRELATPEVAYGDFLGRLVYAYES